MKRLLPIILTICCSLAVNAQSVDGAAIVNTAMQYLGAPYVYGSAGPTAFDCSGFVYWCFSQHDIRLPHSSASQALLGEPVEGNYDALLPGDLVFFGSPNIHHVGIYTGVNEKGKHEFIHSQNKRTGVVITLLEEEYWDHNFRFARRLTDNTIEPNIGQNTEDRQYDSKGSISTHHSGSPKVAESALAGESRVDTAPQMRTRKWKTEIKSGVRRKVVMGQS